MRFKAVPRRSCIRPIASGDLLQYGSRRARPTRTRARRLYNGSPVSRGAGTLSNPCGEAFDSGTRPAREATDRFRPSLARRACGRLIRGARLALPQRCELCVAAAGGALICPRCSAALPRLPVACEVCALPSAGGAICGACLARAPPYAAVVAALVYAFPVDRLLQQLNSTTVADSRSRIGQRPCLQRPSRRRSRAALRISRPIASSHCRSPRRASASEASTRPGRSLRGSRRHSCASRAVLPRLRCRGAARSQRARRVRRRGRAVRGASIAPVDDVMTTGATLAEAARTLRRAGAARVECWVVARTLRPGQD